MSGCPICLRSLPTDAFHKLSGCHHEFCIECLKNYFKFRMESLNVDVWCPLCQTLVPIDDVQSLAPETLSHFVSSRSQSPATEVQSTPVGADASPEAERNFVRLARAEHFRRCPACQAPVQKNGGCNNMKCACGFEFQWNMAPILFPCSQIHFLSSNHHGLFRLVGSTCPDCPVTFSALAKLYFYRAAVAPFVIPAAIATRAVSSSVSLSGSVARGVSNAMRSKSPKKPRLKPYEIPAIKLLVLGSSKSGKTGLLLAQFGSTELEYAPTIFEATSQAVTTGRGITCVVNPVDTSGHEDYQTLRQLLYPGTNALVVCVDVRSTSSVTDALELWIPEARHHSPNNPIILVGTHTDLRSEDSAIPDFQTGQTIAARSNCSAYRECSVTTRQGIQEVFETIYNEALQNMYELAPRPPTVWERVNQVRRRHSFAF